LSKNLYRFILKVKSDIFFFMGDKRKVKLAFKKVVSEQFPINSKKGGGIIKIDAWENEKGEVVKYSLAISIIWYFLMITGES